MIALAIAAGCVLVLAVYVTVMRHENRSDDRRPARHEFPEPEHPGFGDITRELAHDAPWPPARPPAVTVCDLTHRQYPLTSPADFPPRTPTLPAAASTTRLHTQLTGETQEELEPGTAAAAGGSPPPASPPPLPDPAYAAANPGCWPLGWLEDDQFVTDWAARALAETAALVKASYYKPLDGA